MHLPHSIAQIWARFSFPIRLGALGGSAHVLISLIFQAAGTQQMLHNCLLDENTHVSNLVTDRKSFKDFKQEFHKTEVWLAPAQKK